jgi:hypothetical protein
MRTWVKIFGMLTVLLPCVSGYVQQPQPYQFQVINPTAPSSPVPKQPSQQDLQNQRLIEQQRQQQLERQRQERELSNALKEESHAANKTTTINYAFPSLASVQGAAAFYKAYQTIDSMLVGLQPLNLKKAVFLVENAYDNSISYAKFNGQIKYLADVCRQKMFKDGIAPDNREGMNMIIYQVLCDTVDVQNPKTKVYYRSLPFTYDFEDFRGEKDIRQMFVSKLLRTHKGN